MSGSGDAVPAVTFSPNGEINAIDLLKNDHDEVQALFNEYQMLVEGAGTAGDRRALSTRICGLVAVHSMIEEEIFYPAARQAGVDPALLDEASIEHETAKDLIFRIGESQPLDSQYDVRMKVLGEYVGHHVKDEEDALFPECRHADLDLKQIGARLQRRKEQLMRMLKRGEASASHARSPC